MPYALAPGGKIFAHPLHVGGIEQRYNPDPRLRWFAVARIGVNRFGGGRSSGAARCFAVSLFQGAQRHHGLRVFAGGLQDKIGGCQCQRFIESRPRIPERVKIHPGGQIVYIGKQHRDFRCEQILWQTRAEVRGQIAHRSGRIEGNGHRPGVAV